MDRRQADKIASDFFLKLDNDRFFTGKDLSGNLGAIIAVSELEELRQAIAVLAELAWMYEDLE